MQWDLGSLAVYSRSKVPIVSKPGALVLAKLDCTILALSAT